LLDFKYMKIIGLIILIIILSVLIIGSKNSISKGLEGGVSVAQKAQTELPEQLNKTADSTLGQFGDKMISYKDDIVLTFENTLSSMFKQVSSDAANIASSMTSTIISMQLINSFKGLNKEGQERVKETICQ